MAEPQVLEGTEAQPLFEGTIEELVDRQQEFAGMRLQVYAVPQDEELGQDFPDPPTTVRDRAHLEQLLLEGLASPKERVTDQEWIELRREVRERLARRKQSDCVPAQPASAGLALQPGDLSPGNGGSKGSKHV